MKKQKEQIREIQEQNKPVVEQKTAVVEQKTAVVEQPKKTRKKLTPEEREAKMQKAMEKCKKARVENAIRKHEQYLQQLEEHWAEERGKLKEERERAFRKFTCPELIRLFGGWFTLTYAFSVKKMVKSGRKTVEVDTDYYICSQDVSHMDVNSRPGVNKIIQKEYGKDVYGFALIAPASAFGEGGAEL